eukprot:445548_1
MKFGDDYDEFLEMFEDFRSSDGIFASKRKLHYKTHSARDSVKQWLSLRHSRKYGKFAVPMTGIVKAAGTNSATESSFNPLKRYQPPSRNQLGPKTLDLFMFVGVNLMFMKDIVYEYYGIPERMYKKRKYVKKDTEWWDRNKNRNDNDNDDDEKSESSNGDSSSGEFYEDLSGEDSDDEDSNDDEDQDNQ